MPKGSAVADVEAKLKAEYPGNDHAVYGTLNKVGLMRGNKPTKKGLKKANPHSAKRMKTMNRVAKKASRSYGSY